MRKLYRSSWIAGLLLLAFLAGCAQEQPPAPDTAAPTTTSVSAQTEPALPPKSTVELATQPPATSQPTAAPTIAPTAAPTAATTSTALLPTNIWVQSANVVLPLTESSMPLDLAQRGYPTPVYSLTAAPNGAYIAYGTEQGGLALVDMRSGASQELVPGGNGVAGFSFSPDGRELAATTITGNDWTLQVFELESNGVHVLRSGSTMASGGNTMPLVPSPVAWTSDGILVQHILYASDAPPRDPALLDPSDPTGQADQRLYEGPIISVYPSSDGTRFAVVTGELPIGGGVPTAQISVVDQQGNQVAAIRELGPGLVRALHWSPDSSMLVYALATDYSTPNVTLHLVHADGSKPQEVDLAAAGISGAFRDIGWRDNATVLLLTEGEQLNLSALPANTFTASALQPLQTFEGQHPGAGSGRIIYVPR